MFEMLDTKKIVGSLDEKAYFGEQRLKIITDFVDQLVDAYNKDMLELRKSIATLKAENYAYRMIIAKSNFKPFLEEEGEKTV